MSQPPTSEIQVTLDHHLPWTAEEDTFIITAREANAIPLSYEKISDELPLRNRTACRLRYYTLTTAELTSEQAETLTDLWVAARGQMFARRAVLTKTTIEEYEIIAQCFVLQQSLTGGYPQPEVNLGPNHLSRVYHDYRGYRRAMWRSLATYLGLSWLVVENAWVEGNGEFKASQ